MRLLAVKSLELIGQPLDLHLLQSAQIFYLGALLQLLVLLLSDFIELLPQLADEVHLLVDHVVGLAHLVARFFLHFDHLGAQISILR